MFILLHPLHALRKSFFFFCLLHPYDFYFLPFRSDTDDDSYLSICTYFFIALNLDLFSMRMYMILKKKHLMAFSIALSLFFPFRCLFIVLCNVNTCSISLFLQKNGASVRAKKYLPNGEYFFSCDMEITIIFSLPPLLIFHVLIFTMNKQFQIVSMKAI